MTDEKIEELKAATRSANEVLSDLKRTMKQVTQLLHQIEHRIDTAFEEKIAETVKETLDKYQTSLDQAVEDGTNAVLKRFDDLAAIMLGETKDQRRQHEETIPDLIEKAAAKKQAPRIPTKKGTW